MCPLPLLRNEIFDTPLVIENTGNNLRYISKRCFNTNHMWFYGFFTNGYSINSTEFCEEIHDNSDNSDVIVLLKTEHIYLFIFSLGLRLLSVILDLLLEAV